MKTTRQSNSDGWYYSLPWRCVMLPDGCVPGESPLEVDDAGGALAGFDD